MEDQNAVAEFFVRVLITAAAVIMFVLLLPIDWWQAIQ